MKKVFLNKMLFPMLSMLVILPQSLYAQATEEKIDIFVGYFAREGNNESPAETTKHNIYMKFFEDQWVVTLHVPLTDDSNKNPEAVGKALQQAKQQTTSPAYIRDTFGQLQERAIATIEKFGYVEDRILFECNSLSPCSAKLKEDYLELTKPGMLNEHIIKYYQIVTNDIQH